jgi:hypothetical protein
MQELYYISGSSITSSLLLIKEDKTSNNWNDVNLIICGSLGEIIVTSGSKNVVSFPIYNTNIYYSDSSSSLYPPPIQTSFIPSSTLSWTFNFANLDPDYLVYDSPSYYISSSAFYYSASGSSATGSTTTLIVNTGLYDIALSSSFATFPSSYTSSISVYYNSLTTSIVPGILIYSISGSSNVPLSASLFLSASNSYTIAMFIQGTYGLS